jgi:hypothetical protein
MCMTFATLIPMFVDVVGQCEYTAKLRRTGIMGFIQTKGHDSQRITVPCPKLRRTRLHLTQLCLTRI